MKINMLVAGILVLATMGCASSRITHSWKSANAVATKYNKIMVVALTNSSDLGLRNEMENHLIGDLSERGFTAISSLKDYGPKSFENMKEDEVIAKLYNSGVDAVITVVLLDKQKERYYVPGRVYYSPYTIYHRRFWGYYTTIYERVYSPGYYQTDTKYFWESNLYDMTKKELVYSVQTESFNPGSSSELAHEYGKIIIGDIMKNNLLR